MRALFEYGPLLGWAGLLLLFVRPLKLGRAATCALGFFLLFATQKFLIYKIFGGDAFVPDLPETFIHLTGWCYSASVMLGCFAFVWMLVCIGRRVCVRRRPTFSLRTNRVALSVCAVLAVALAGWGVWEGVRVPRVREVSVSVKDWPRGFDGFRVVQLSDLHCSPAARRERTQGIVAAVNALKPDLICITGDFLDGSPDARRDDLAPLKDLRAPFGVFGCAGNHEYYYDYAVWKPELEALGVRLLDNAHVVLARNGAQLVLGGVTDLAARRNNRRLMDGPDVGRAFAGSPTNACRVLLQHRPIGLDSNGAQHVRLQLSGHTHGGAVLGLDRLIKMYNQGHVKGLYQDDDLTLYVCPGTGQWAGFPVRLGVPAEITLLTVHPQGEEK